MHLPNCLIDFPKPPFLFQSINQGADFGGSVHALLDGRLLVMLAHLYAKVSTARVDDDVDMSLVILVHFDEMVATTKRANGKKSLFPVNGVQSF